MAFCFYMTPFFFSATSNNIGMVSLIDKNKKTVGYIYNNAIMHPTTFLLSGIILGGCVYNHHGIMIGKYFRNKMYNTAGEIAALTEFVTLKEDVDYAVLSYQVWQLIPKIHLVESKWIQPQSKWSAEPLSRLLQ